MERIDLLTEGQRSRLSRNERIVERYSELYNKHKPVASGYRICRIVGKEYGVSAQLVYDITKKANAGRGAKE